ETVSIEDVRTALDGARVNLANVRIMGAARCDVTGNAAPQPHVRAGTPRKPPVRASRLQVRSAKSSTPAITPVRTASLEPSARAEVDDDGTLESELRREIDRRVADLGGRA